MDSKGGPQSSEETKKKKKNPSPTKPNNGQNSTTPSAGPSTPSKSNKQEPSKGDGGRKTETACEAAGLRPNRKPHPVTDKKKRAASLRETVCGTETRKSPKLTEKRVPPIEAACGKRDASNSQTPRDNKETTEKKPTKSHECAVDAAGIGKKRQDTR